jgi:hypothetical protein
MHEVIIYTLSIAGQAVTSDGRITELRTAKEFAGISRDPAEVITSVLD